MLSTATVRQPVGSNTGLMGIVSHAGVPNARMQRPCASADVNGAPTARSPSACRTCRRETAFSMRRLRLRDASRPRLEWPDRAGPATGCLFVLAFDRSIHVNEDASTGDRSL